MRGEGALSIPTSHLHIFFLSSLHVEFKLSELISITIDEFTASPRYNSLDKEGRSGTSQQHLLKASL